MFKYSPPMNANWWRFRNSIKKNSARSISIRTNLLQNREKPTFLAFLFSSWTRTSKVPLFFDLVWRTTSTKSIPNKKSFAATFRRTLKIRAARDQPMRRIWIHIYDRKSNPLFSDMIVTILALDIKGSCTRLRGSEVNLLQNTYTN